MPSLIILVTQIGTPMALLAWLVFAPVHSVAEGASRILVVTTGMALLLLVQRWDWYSYHLRTMLIVATLAATGWTIAAMVSAPLVPDADAWIEIAVVSAVEAILVAALWRPLRGRRYDRAKSIGVAFPLRGKRFYVVHGGSDPTVNYHYPHATQRYAVDIVQLGRHGRRFRRWRSADLSTYTIFGARLYSPVTGVVIAAVDGYLDQMPPLRDPSRPAGNHVAIQPTGTDTYLVLAHLQCGSVAISAGDAVDAGDLVGCVGNSGHSFEPHLHIHAAKLSGHDFLDGGHGVPITFDGRYLVRNAVISS